MRDTVVAAAVFAVVLIPPVYDVGPDVLAAPGYVLYAPLVLVYAATGGELEGAHGPAAPFVVGFALALGVVAAAVAHLLRRHVDTSGLARLRFVAAGALAVVGTLAGLLGLGALGSLLYVPTPTAVAALVGGVVLVAGGLALATRTPTE